MTDADLASGVAALGSALRERGVRVSLSDELDAAQALARLRPAGREETRCALRIALKIRRCDWDRLEEVLDETWGESAARPRSFRPPAARDAPRHGLVTGALGAHPRGEDEERGPGGREDANGRAPGYSAEALLRHKPFEDCSTADLAAMVRVLARLAARLGTCPSRRLVPSRGRGVPDVRRSMRRALATEGELLSLARRARAVEEPRLVVLCDTSGSMDRHARFLLAFVLSLRRAARSTEVFAFNTELVRLTPWLASGEVLATLDRLASRVPDWSGGTRIGDSLARFVADHLHARVDARTVVLILSDGLDRGDPTVLAGAMRAVQARARKVIWLNPLLGDPRYAPTARGMAAALPFVDQFLPAHDLASLEQLLPHLSA